MVAPIIAGGNTCIVLASNSYPLPSITFAEVLNSSDVPNGVVNIITGKKEELAEHFASHMDVNALSYTDNLAPTLKKTIDELAAENIKRVVKTMINDWYAEDAQSPYFITNTQETKTTWHPIGF
jgi:acyl-CoA reductase-like NAD-dependent aldehyde dehydrogenase